MRNWAARLACLALAALLAVPTVPAGCACARQGASDGGAESAEAIADQGPILRVAFPETEGVSMVDDKGERSGIFYDWLVEIAKYTGWRYEFVDGDAEELMERTSAGELDLVGGMYYREQLEASYDYSGFPIGTNRALLVTSKDNEDVSSFDLRTLDGKTIGVFKNATEKTRRLESFLELNNVECAVVRLDQEAYASCLEDGTADVVLGGTLEMRDDRKVVAQFESEPYYIAFPEGSGLRAQLDDAMGKVLAANSNFSEELYNAYFPAEYAAPIEFSEEDRAFVASADPVEVAVVVGQYPMYYLRDGAYQGVAKDVFDLIAERTGLTFRFQHASTYQDALDLVASGGADVAGWFMDGEHEASRQGLALTKRFAELDDVVLRNKLFDSAGGAVIAQLAGRDVPAEFEGAEVVYYPTYEECLQAVNAGRADYTCMPASYAESLFVARSYANLTPATSERPETAFSVAFPAPVDSALYSVMSKAVNSLDEGELDSIVSRNAAPINDRPMTIESFLAENPLVVVVFCLVLLLLVGAIAMVVSVSKVRNRVMAIKLEKAEETGRAKTDFLSRMSHEIRTPMNAIIGLSNVASLSGEATPAIRSSLEKINTSAQFLLSLVNDILDMSKIENDKMHIETAPLSLPSLADRLDNMFRIQAEERGLALKVRCSAAGPVVGDDVRLQQVLANLLTNAFKFTDEGGAVVLCVDELSRDEDSARIRFSVSDNGEGIRAHDLERIFVSFEQAAENRRNAQGTGLGLAICSNLVRLMGGRLKVESVFGAGSEFFFELDMPVCDEESLGAVSDGTAGSGEAAAPSLAGARVLLAEDNDLNAEIAVALLEMQGVEVDRAADGCAAVGLFERSEPGHYDAVLMDVKMPLLDGLGAARSIRGLARPDAASVPIVALTANTFQEDREEAAAAGMNGFVAKPFDAHVLYDTLRGFVKPKE